MATEFLFEILTPQNTCYSGRVTSLVAPGSDGFFGVLAHHAPLIARSSGGKLKIREESGSQQHFQVGPGIFEVLSNRAVLLTKQAQVRSAETASPPATH